MAMSKCEAIQRSVRELTTIIRRLQKAGCWDIADRLRGDQTRLEVVLERYYKTGVLKEHHE